REFVKDPQVQIVVTQVRANQVNVLGQVGRPGRYPLDLTGMRLTEVLALAGGIVAGVGSDTVVVTGTRDGKSFRKDVDMPSLFRAGNGAEDIVIAPGDSVFVDRAPQIYMYGEIQHPGPIRLERGMTVMQAVAAGGGATPRGTLRGLKVTRTGPDGKQQTLEPTMEDTLRNGDVVYIRESLF
ncbi:MAG TPA: SLBB domain-containing protein, partial [Burkholderiaceae bacterium]|nr:SLBB domain-containing protein [Burkholderiaceae bacterium]